MVFLVDQDNKAAWDAVMKICEAKPRAGSIIPISHEEFEALQSGVIMLDAPEELVDG